ncbi:hypothetical protein CPHO_04850 [Corynebacterium phocae]|uniref:Or membrane protein n=1 Tax=Corynebacterium phocae TaxID=161895 RepID=A0A1L7D2M7_9CORY|nr:hypothetical protein [Corynebacterium phocae]APT92327.1 hypothetical protein CPHO_04850 [Corynebacterium phocae]KAA8724918.1 hypothetical protein F4V58_04380 [Corynebacterium phocae]
MRIRKAALAGATAIAVTFSGTVAATAQETTETNTGSSSIFPSEKRADTDAEGNLINNGDKKDSTMSSKLGSLLDATKPADGTKIFGDDADVSSQPKWAQALYGVGIASIVITILGGLVGPVLNFIQYGPFSR